MSTVWHKAALVSDLAEDEPLTLKLAGKEVGLFQLDEEYYAIEDVCPHAYALLSQGFADGEEIECPLHNAVFHIKTGKCIKEPGRDLITFDVKVDGEQISVKL
ncbi:MAG: Rieske (2Fe-2S) protein [Alphaproteobacteria bacterium]|nr:MAG: Rieske (2Fe-2S) protein [Alphaproteobacteria bacterium]